MKLRTWLIVLVLGGAVVGAGAAGYYWWLAPGYITTDNCFIDTSVSPVSSRVHGTVQNILVNDNQWVEKGEPLIRLDPVEFQLEVERRRNELEEQKHRVQEAQIRLALARNRVRLAREKLRGDSPQLKYRRSNFERARELLRQDNIARDRFDEIRSSYRSMQSQLTEDRLRITQREEEVQRASVQLDLARSRLRQSRVKLKQAKQRLSYTRIEAPIAGRVTAGEVDPGEVVEAGQLLLRLVDNRQPAAWANLKETKIARIRPGQRVRLHVDAYPNKTFHGHVHSIQSGSGAAFSLLPPENATGNYVKVVQRIPVKIVFDDDPDLGTKYVLGPGMSVVPEILIHEPPDPEYIPDQHQPVASSRRDHDTPSRTP